MAKRKKASGRGGWRPGAGRKPLFAASTDLTIRFEQAHFEALEALAQERRSSVAAVVREAVAQYVAHKRS